MMKYLFAFLLGFCMIAHAEAQKKVWKTIVFTDAAKVKGLLKEANEKSIVLQTKQGANTILFSNINRLKFVRTDNEAIKVVVGGVAGATLGAAITAGQLSKDKEGEPKALSGVVGGIGGGIIGGIVGAVTGSLISDLLFAKRIKIEHTDNFYHSLSQKLQSYIVK